MFRCFTWLALVSATSALGVSLEETYKVALEKSENLLTETSNTAIASEKVSQGWGAVFPKLALNGSYSRQDSSGTATSTSTLTAQEQTVAKLTLTQPLFHGLSDFWELRARKARLRAIESTLSFKRKSLYESVAIAYYQVLTQENDLNNLNALLDLSSKRVAQLKQRTKIGRSRRGELLAAEAQVATLQAQREAVESEVVQSREALQLVATIPANSKLDDLVENTDPAPKPLGEWEKSLKDREDLVAKREEVTSADQTVAAYWGQHLPSLDFTGNYYLKRPDALSDIKWDLGLQLTIPIFYGGTVQSQVREASEVRKQAELALALAERSARKELKVAHDTLKSALAQKKALKEALTISEANYKEQNKDYSLGLVTNLEVISALNQMYETRRLYDRTRYKVRVAQITLEVTSGTWKEPS